MISIVVTLQFRKESNVIYFRLIFTVHILILFPSYLVQYFDNLSKFMFDRKCCKMMEV